MRPGLAVVGELLPDRVPALASISRALDDLTEPAGVRGGVHAVRARRRPPDMKDLPPCEVGPVHRPLPTGSVRRQDERSLARADENPNAAHVVSLSSGRSEPE